MSFSYNAINRVQKLAPRLPVVILIEKAHHWPMLRQIVSRDWIIGPGIRELTDHPGWVATYARRAAIHVWTVDTQEQLELCLDLGVTAVISDRPAYMLELLDR